jgi:hypothetical protein
VNKNATAQKRIVLSTQIKNEKQIFEVQDLLWLVFILIYLQVFADDNRMNLKNDVFIEIFGFLKFTAPARISHF